MNRQRELVINAIIQFYMYNGGFYREVRIPNLSRGLHLGGAFWPGPTASSTSMNAAPSSASIEARRPVGEIAERLGRHPSTIYRELGRNRFRDGDRGFCGYFPLNAQDLARRRRQRGRKLAADEGLRAHVTERLKAGWSPQQIAGRLKRDEADGGPTVCHETIYRHVYGPGGPRGRPLPPPAEGAPAAREPLRPQAAQRLRSRASAGSRTGRRRSRTARASATGRPTC